jgi:hypothetical protein
MSNRNDFDFDDDFFQDDDQFEFGGDEELPAGLGDEFDEDMPFIEEEGDGGGGGSRTFVVLAILMILLFIGGLALVLFLILRPTGPSDLELTATQVVLLNQTVEAQLAGTQTLAREFEIMTLTAAAFTDTPSPTATDTPVTRPPTVTPTGTLDLTEMAATQNAINLAQTATAIALASLASPTPDLTLTAQGFSPTPSPTIQVTSALEAVNQTATAIAGAFLTATAQAAGTAVVVPTGGVTPGFTPVATALPDTGLFDTIATGGSEGVGLLALAVVGLVGVVFLSRRVRTMNAKAAATVSSTPPDQVS